MDRERYAGRVEATDDNEGTLDKLLRATKEHLKAFLDEKIRSMTVPETT